MSDGEADVSAQAPGPAWFHTRLALRLAVPPDRTAWMQAQRVAWSAALLAPPVTITMIAPTGRLTAGTLLRLLCAALPGCAALAWSVAALGHARRLTLHGLLQAGAQRRTARLVAAGRMCLFAASGAVGGAVLVALLHSPVGRIAPRRSPLHGMFGADATTWLVAIMLTAALCVLISLAAGRIRTRPSRVRATARPPR